MISISLCMIVKNEEKTIARLLDSIKGLVDEIIIVDTGSNDNTKKIVSSYTDKIYDFKWVNDFSAARNYAFSLANKEYCLWLDADDVVLEDDYNNFKSLKENLSNDVSVVMMKYNTNFDEDNNPTFSFYRERLLRREDEFKWAGFIHEAISVRGKVYYSDIAITHKKLDKEYSRRNLDIYEYHLELGTHFNPRDKFYFAREMYYHAKFEKAIEKYQEFLLEDGWIENKIEACQFIALCYKRLNKERDYISWLINSFVYDKPRAEICCDIGAYFYDKKKYDLSIYWYSIASSCVRNDSSGAFVKPECYGYIPFIQLCLCYYAINDIDKAIACNKRAGEFKPNDRAYLYNVEFFDKLKKV